MTNSILFLDDAQPIQGALKDIFSMRSEWKMFYALSGSQVLKIISEDVIEFVA